MAWIEPIKTTVQTNVPFDLRVKFGNSGTPVRIFNPFLNGLLPLPVQLALFDSRAVHR